MSVILFLAAAAAASGPAVKTTVSGDAKFVREAVVALKKCGVVTVNAKAGRRGIDTRYPVESKQYACAIRWRDKHYPGAIMGGPIDVINY